MKTLILVRHAKSSWEAPLRDYERPLQQRGIQDAHLVSLYICSSLPSQFIIYSSPARRAKDTAKIFAQNCSYPVESIIYTDELYTFDRQNLESEIKKLNNQYDNVMLFGHNEAITDFVNKFGDIFLENVSTCGVVSITFDIDEWSEIRHGKTTNVVFPKDLKHDHNPI
jgi:phosphohistidine phosphatase